MEGAVEPSGRKMADMNLDELEVEWQRAERSAFVMTESELSVIAALAQMGLISQPTNG